MVIDNLGGMAIPNLAFRYKFRVQQRRVNQTAVPIPARRSAPGVAPWNTWWSGQGSGEGFAGPNPQFELCAGWLTLFPSCQWTQSLPLHWFSDAQRRHEEKRDEAAHRPGLEDLVKASMRDGKIDTDAVKRGMEEAARRGRRDLASYGVLVGEPLERMLRIDDELKFSSDSWGNFAYSVRRTSETLFSVGSVGPIDEGGPFAVWQAPEAYAEYRAEYDKEFAKAPPSSPDETAGSTNRQASIARALEDSERRQAFVDAHKAYVSARVYDRTFRLAAGQGVRVGPYYVFLVREDAVGCSLGSSPELAVHAAGRIDEVGRELIVEDAGYRLFAPRTVLM